MLGFGKNAILDVWVLSEFRKQKGVEEIGWSDFIYKLLDRIPKSCNYMYGLLCRSFWENLTKDSEEKGFFLILYCQRESVDG